MGGIGVGIISFSNQPAQLVDITRKTHMIDQPRLPSAGHNLRLIIIVYQPADVRLIGATQSGAKTLTWYFARPCLSCRVHDSPGYEAARVTFWWNGYSADATHKPTCIQRNPLAEDPTRLITAGLRVQGPSKMSALYPPVTPEWCAILFAPRRDGDCDEASEHSSWCFFPVTWHPI